MLNVFLSSLHSRVYSGIHASIQSDEFYSKELLSSDMDWYPIGCLEYNMKKLLYC